MKKFFRILIVIAYFISFNARAVVDEGMWVYNNLPKEQLKAKYGFEVSDQWADHLMKSSVRFNSGGSGSFISSNGLVITNHHVGADTLYKISTPEKNYYEDGYKAEDFSQEVAAPDLELNQLRSITDVTARVNSVVKPEMTPAEAFSARKSEMATIEKEAFEKTGLRSDVVTLYNGGQYHLYQYKKYTDVRLVFAPEFKVAFFGGDPDNFEFPRFDLDICIFRVYENGVPAKIENFLAWSFEGTKPGDLTFVSGHPGSTNRMFTMAALEFTRDVRLPLTLEYLYRSEIALQQYMNEGEEQSRRAHDDYFGVQNSRKANVGRLQGLQDKNLMDIKRATEEDLRARVKANSDLQKYAGAWDKIAQAQVEFKKLYIPYIMLEGARGFNSQLFKLARMMVRLAAESQKPNSERFPEYRDSARGSLEQELYSEAPLYADLEQAKLVDSLTYLSEKLGGSHPLVEQVLDGKSVTNKAAILAKTEIFDVNYRKKLVSLGQEGIDKSSDPMIRLAALVDAESRKWRKEYEDKVDGASQDAYAMIAKAKFALNGESDYPDATFTLRLSYGEVAGYEENGTQVPAQTTIGGAFEHEAKHGGKYPYELPESWHLNKDKLDLTTPMNFVSTADIIGGNSGSPVVNRAGEFVGIIFDGNIQSLPLAFIYSDLQARAVSVNSNVIVESMRKIYNAGAIVDQFGK